MGAIILFGLFVLAIVALILPAMHARSRRNRGDDERRLEHDEVVRRLNDGGKPPERRGSSDE